VGFPAHPELRFDVHRTAGSVAEKLKGFGCDEVVPGIGRTGVVGVIRGRKTGSKVIGLRADMDALPLEEETGLPYKSTVSGKMHACGHDGHMAMLLGAAKYLAETRNFAGTAVVIFQPAEEGGAGALAMIKDGLISRFGIQEVYGIHNFPGLPVGEFAIRPGAIMAAADHLQIQIDGKGGHAARPRLSIDTILVGAQMINQLQSIVARNVDPLESTVVSVCMFQAGHESLCSSSRHASAWLLEFKRRWLGVWLRAQQAAAVNRISYLFSDTDLTDCPSTTNYKTTLIPASGNQRAAKTSLTSDARRTQFCSMRRIRSQAASMKGHGEFDNNARPDGWNIW
jgi:metal-dependent amidase/aminoacylase/carboxypeptidase family protein